MGCAQVKLLDFLEMGIMEDVLSMLGLVFPTVAGKILTPSRAEEPHAEEDVQACSACDVSVCIIAKFL